MNNTNNASARESFQHARQMFYKAFRKDFSEGPQGDKRCQEFVNSLKLSQSEVRLEVQLLTTANQFVFGLTPNQVNTNNVVFNTEQRLNLQDSLCVNEYGIYVGKPSAQASTAWKLRTYGNLVDFTANAATALNTTFYSHGSFQIRCNNDVIMPYRGLFNHLYKPQTQQTAAVGADSPDDQIRGAEDACITQEPNIVLIGSKNYQPSIQLPAALGTVDEFTRAVVIFKGILAQNSTVVN